MLCLTKKKIFFRYLENARTVSKRYRDQPMTPTDTMVYWSEYVIRHKGATHLRSSGLDLNYIEYHNLDVFMTIFFIIIFSVYTVKWVLKKICCKKSRLEVKQEKKDK